MKLSFVEKLTVVVVLEMDGDRFGGTTNYY